MTISRTNVAAAVWGLAEATFFFIVPDVFLSWVALKDPARAFRACLWALGGALVGGAIVWYAGSQNPEPLRTFYTSIPAISEQMIANVRLQLGTEGLVALFIGPLSGTPYKIYALEAAGASFAIGIFLLVSIPARLLRFALVTGVVAIVSKGLRQFIGMRQLRIILVVVWVSFYTFYFYVMSGI